MKDVKWIKLTTDMFDNVKIRHIRKMPEGNNIVLIWCMLLTMAGRCNAGGMIFITENIPYTTKDLADELDFEESVIVLALNVLERFGMIFRDEEVLSIPGWEDHQSAERLAELKREKDRIRKQRERETKKLPMPEPDDTIRDPEECKVPAAYSFATHSNVSNLEHTIQGNDELRASIGADPKMLEIVQNWMAYKDERKPKTSNHYGSEKGIKTLLARFMKCDKDYGTDVVEELVNNSIANNWQGIMWNDADRAKRTVTGRKQKELKPKLYIPPKLTD